MKFLAILTTLTTLLTASESMTDLRIAVDPFDAKNRSHVDFVAQASFDAGKFSFLVNPELAVYLNKSVDFGISLGHRWPFMNGAIGHHVFFDRSQMPTISVNQVGSGIDWLTPFMDFRANYYHPISPAITLKDRLVKPCKWGELEAVYKTKYFNVAAGPNFNFDSRILGAQSRFVIPFERFSLGIGGTIDQSGKKEAFLLTSFHLYRDKGGQYSNIPASHSKRPKVEFITVKLKQKKTEDKKVHKLEEAKKKFDEEDLQPIVEAIDDAEELTFDEEVDKYWTERAERERREAEKEVVAPPAIPIQPEEKGIWDSIKDFFFGKSRENPT